MAKTKAILSEQGNPMYVSEGAVAQQGKLKLMQCTTCGFEVVWCKSKRTGNFYLVNVRQGHTGRRYYVGRDIHKRDKCQAKQMQ